MEIVKGQVVSNVDSTRSGVFLAMFPTIDADAHKVTYTSPFFKANAGGFLGIPDVDDEILALYNKEPEEGENEFYYHSTIVNKRNISDKESNPNFNTVAENDRSPYNEKGKPVMQHFTNHAGAGLYIHREFATSKISNNVTMRSDTGEEVNVGPVGVQIRNADGDSITLNGAEPNDAYGARTLSIETHSSQEYKCVAGDINMKIVDGGDINIENNSFGIFALPPWFGNIRLKSRFRDITLAALGPTSKIHIVTNGTQVIVDSLGGVKIVTAGSIDFAAAQDINMTAGGSVNIVGGLGAQLGSVAGAAGITAPAPTINGQTIAFNAGPPGSDFTNSIPIPGTPATPPIPPVIVPNDYGDPVGGAV
jgi:hypothetical protein